jgi:3-phosphoshikimate 1-carboxyvinyltransferase
VDDGSDRIVHPARRVSGRVRVPGDKSISHRALMLGALAGGVTCVRGLAPGADVRATRECLEASGVSISAMDGAGVLTVRGRGLRGLQPAAGGLDALNSGTTARLMMGILAAHPFSSRLTGDASLSRRPMRRVAQPLEAMGCRIDTSDGRLPVTVHGTDLHGVTWAPPVPSAQVKTAVLLAGIQAEGCTTVVESASTRDHTERALRLFGADVRVGPSGVSVSGGVSLQGAEVNVPGDPSSAAFFAAAAAALPGSRVIIEGVGLNPTRIGFLDVLRRFGADVSSDVLDDRATEPSGTISVAFADRRAVVIDAEEVPGVIDELPVLGAIAALGGAVTVRGAAELRVKESDRIHALVTGLAAFGAAVEEFPDGFSVAAASRLTGASVDAAGDHRLAMAFAVVALGADGPTRIRGAEAVAISYPGFFEALEGLCQ